MKKIVLIPDSFKGTASSVEICEMMEREIHACFPGAGVVSVPVADGGEGSVDCFLQALGGQRIAATVKGPFMEDMEAYYGLLDGGKTAVVEMAACAGLPLVEDCKDPLRATTYGVGQLMLDAAGRGAKRIIVGLGGSCTNDGGCGAAAAAGVQFLDGSGKPFVPTGGTLQNITGVSLAGLDPSLGGVEIVTMCDIDNPLCGDTGASAVFGPQKGADPAMVALLDEGLLHLSKVVQRDLGRDIALLPGAGAAGGMGGGMVAFFDSKLQMGIDTVLDAVGFTDLIQGADLILTGEGRIDGQSLRGKVVIGVARRAKDSGVPVVAIVGDIADGAEAAYGEGVAGIFSTNRVAVDWSKAKLTAKSDLSKTIYNLMHFLMKMGH